jgi:hypothetical protein
MQADMAKPLQRGSFASQKWLRNIEIHAILTEFETASNMRRNHGSLE